MELKDLELEYGIKFVSFNPHPENELSKARGNRWNDCYIVALVKVLNLPYESVYDELFDMASELLLQPNDMYNISKYCKKHGLKIVEVDKETSIGEFIKNNKSGTYVISSARHMVSYIDGVIYDTNVVHDKDSLYDFYQDFFSKTKKRIFILED